MRRLALVLAAAGAALLPAACGGGGGNHIVLYSGEHPELVTALVHAFEQRTGITVDVRSNDSVVLAQQLLGEGSHSPADVYLAENSPELMLLQEHGRLSQLPESVLSQVPAAASSPTGQWVGIAARVTALVYNPSRISAAELPASVLDLATPAWSGRVAVAPSDSDFVPVVGAVLAQDGASRAAAWLAGLKRNAAVYQDTEGVVAAVDAGDRAVGIINQYDWYRLRNERGAAGVHSAVHYFPHGDAGSVENFAGGGVVSGSAHADAAAQFLGFVVGAEGQQILAGGDDFEYPIRPGVAPNPALTPLAAVDPTVLGVAQLGDDAQAARLLQETGFQG